MGVEGTHNIVWEVTEEIDDFPLVQSGKGQYQVDHFTWDFEGDWGFNRQRDWKLHSSKRNDRRHDMDRT